MIFDGLTMLQLFSYLAEQEAGVGVAPGWWGRLAQSQGNYLLLLVGVMVLLGLLGGLANYFLMQNRLGAKRPSVAATSLVAVVTVLITVPIILNLASGILLEETQKRPVLLLVFAGLCLVAALCSQLFFRTPDPITQTVNPELDLRLRELEATLSEPEADDLLAIMQGFDDSALRPEDYRIIEVLESGPYLYRSLSGISGTLSMPRDVVLKRLALLTREGIVRQHVGFDGQNRFRLSLKGRAVRNRSAVAKLMTSEDT
jgi:hypothetical protein